LVAGPSAAKFITIEGGEGAGKSTQARLLQAALAAAGLRVVLTREPGGTRGAEALRGLLLSGDYDFSLPAETLLHFAARADHVEQLIRPALARGEWVISDRFVDSTMVYQGFGQGGDREAIARLAAMLGLAADLTIVLDVDIETSLARLAHRAERLDRYERLGADFFRRVRDGFLQVARADPQRCVLIQAGDPPKTVAARIWQAVRSRLTMPA
jgi:dTMP kinase